MTPLQRTRTILRSGLPHAEQLTLLNLADHLGGKDPDGWSWPSVATLASYMGRKPRAVQRTLSSLVGRGLIAAELRPGQTTRYRLVWDKIRAVTPVVDDTTPLSPVTPRRERHPVTNDTPTPVVGDTPPPSWATPEVDKGSRPLEVDQEEQASDASARDPSSLSERLVRLLKSEGLDSMTKVSKLNRKQLLDIPGLGPSSVTKIERALEAKGLSLQPVPEKPKRDMTNAKAITDLWTEEFGEAYPWRDYFRVESVVADRIHATARGNLDEVRRAFRRYIADARRGEAWPPGPPALDKFERKSTEWLLKARQAAPRKPVADVGGIPADDMVAVVLDIARQLRDGTRPLFVTWPRWLDRLDDRRVRLARRVEQEADAVKNINDESGARVLLEGAA